MSQLFGSLGASKTSVNPLTIDGVMMLNRFTSCDIFRVQATPK